MKKKSLNKKLKLQKENIVNLNQLNSIKGGIIPTGSIFTDTCDITGGPHSVDPSDTIDTIIMY